MNYIYELLENEVKRLEVAIGHENNNQLKADLIGNKNLVLYSLKLLKKCESYGIQPNSMFTTLPEQRCQSPSSEYRIVEDCETDNPQLWIELKVKDRYVRLHQGDVVIEV
jgi:hypothetical protein